MARSAWKIMGVTNSTNSPATRDFSCARAPARACIRHGETVGECLTPKVPERRENTEYRVVPEHTPVCRHFKEGSMRRISLSLHGRLTRAHTRPHAPSAGARSRAQPRARPRAIPFFLYISFLPVYKTRENSFSRRSLPAALFSHKIPREAITARSRSTPRFRSLSMTSFRDSSFALENFRPRTGDLLLNLSRAFAPFFGFCFDEAARSWPQIRHENARSRAVFVLSRSRGRSACVFRKF